MESTKLILIACFCVAICHGFSSDEFSFPNFLPAANNSAGAWEYFKSLKDARKGDSMKNMLNLKQYFQKFGYLSEGGNMTEDFDEMVESAVKMYQRNFGLNVTGSLDEQTVSQLMTPRCGREDVINGTSVMSKIWKNNGSGTTDDGFIHSVQHYTFFPGRPRWSAYKRDLTYAFDSAHEVTEITPADMQAAFASAFQRWADVIPMTFTETDNYPSADIKIGFFRGGHGDGQPFDGVLGTLAHAFSPEDGRFHLDAAESWTVNVHGDSAMTAIDLESVATHEIGHLLGLGHTNVKEAIMYPSIPTRTKKVDLGDDDVEGVQSLYGSNPNYNNSVNTPTQREETSNLPGGDSSMNSPSTWTLVLFISLFLVGDCRYPLDFSS